MFQKVFSDRAVCLTQYELLYRFQLAQDWGVPVKLIV